MSCKFVDDDSLSTLPRFPALRQIMPMDVPDEGFRHLGRCEALEALWCMYCRDTTDAATEHIAGLSKLKTYYAGQTKITDRSLEILSHMPSLEKLEFWNCAGITNAGVRSSRRASWLARDQPRWLPAGHPGCGCGISGARPRKLLGLTGRIPVTMTIPDWLEPMAATLTRGSLFGSRVDPPVQLR